MKKLQIVERKKDRELYQLISSWLKKYQVHFDVKGEVISLKKFDDYAQNFGLQWNEFQLTQFDSHSGLPLTENRLKNSSGWNLEDLRNKKILEIGGGAGRFTEIFLKHGAKVVCIDLSSAVFANSLNNSNRNVIFLRGSFENLKGLEGRFDYVFCYGVAQHTPDPQAVYKSCFELVKPNGFLSIDHYLKVWYPSPYYFPKYFWRPITTRIKPESLLSIIRTYIPIYIQLDTLLIKFIPSRKLSSLIRGVIPIPCWNYFGIENIRQDKENLVQWAIMDTFDALGAKYDYPASLKTVRKWANCLGMKNFEVKRGDNGVVLNCKK